MKNKKIHFSSRTVKPRDSNVVVVVDKSGRCSDAASNAETKSTVTC